MRTVIHVTGQGADIYQTGHVRTLLIDVSRLESQPPDQTEDEWLNFKPKGSEVFRKSCP